MYESASMAPISVSAGTRLEVTYSFHPARHPSRDEVLVLHHGICHTHEQFLPLIEQLNRLGFHAVMIDQQSEQAGFFRNAIGATQYVRGMTAAIHQVEQETGRKIGGYVLHSMGALIGEEVQQKHVELQRPTVLLAPISINGAFPITLRILWKHPLSYLKAVFTLDILSLARTEEQVRELFFDKHTPNDIVDRTTPQLKHAPFWIYCQLVLRWLVRPWIADDKLPKLLLTSDSDEIFHPREYDKTLRCYSQLKHAVIPGGHDFFIQNAEQTATQVADFFLVSDEEARALPETEATSGRHVPPPHRPARPSTVKPARRRPGSR